MARQVKIVTRRKIWLSFLAVALIALFCLAVVLPKVPSFIPFSGFFNGFSPHLGLDLQGGTHLVYQADLSQISSQDRSNALEGVRDVIERRINAFGVAEPLVQTISGERLVVELAGVKDVNEAINQIGETPLLEFKEATEAKPSELSSSDKQAAVLFNNGQLAKANDIIKRLQSGENFGDLAKEFSDDSTKDSGGDLGFAKRGQFVPEFEKAIFDDLKTGDFTLSPVKSQFGYHIIKKLEEKSEGDNKEIRSAHILLSTKDEQLAETEGVDWLNTNLSGKNLTSATVEFDQNTGSPMVSLKFDSEGKDYFGEITKRNIGEIVGIFLDGQLISAPTVQEEITQGSAVISGKFNIAEAKLLAQRLNAGALPVPISLVSQQTVGPALGKISLQKSLLAGLIGIAVVMLFMIMFYRLPGIIASIALIIYSLISMTIFEAWPVTLTLSGIAGFILSIGMAVDANVLIFERMKEELRNGKPMGTAIEEGFKRAWLSIRDSNVSSIITCLILFWFGASLVKGFAVTLAIGILVSMFSAITISRTLLRLIAGKYLSNHLWLMGLSKKKSE